MGQYLNSKEPYDQYKTEILEELIPALEQESVMIKKRKRIPVR